SYLTLGGNVNKEDLATVTIGYQGNNVINNKNLRYSLTGIINQEYGINGQFIAGIGTYSKAFLFVGFDMKKDIIKNQEYDGEKFDFNNRIYNVNTGFGFEFNKDLMFLSGVGFEKSDVDKNKDNSKNVDISYPFYNAQLIYDTRNSIVYTTKGVYLKTNYTYGNSGDTNFNALEFIGEVNVPIGKKLTLIPSLGYLTSSGDNIPETYEPKLGGYKTRDFSMKFKGLDENSVRGQSILAGNLKLQYSVNKFMYMDMGISYASISKSEFSLNGDDDKKSYDIGLGLKTPLGPGYMGLSKANGESVKYYLNLGYELDSD
ncbi:MAG: patatin, partial [Sebaldella sp.]|nr:patatin [Sebaldella sp.]